MNIKKLEADLEKEYGHFTDDWYTYMPSVRNALDEQKAIIDIDYYNGMDGESFVAVSYYSHKLKKRILLDEDMLLYDSFEELATKLVDLNNDAILIEDTRIVAKL